MDTRLFQEVFEESISFFLFYNKCKKCYKNNIGSHSFKITLSSHHYRKVRKGNKILHMLPYSVLVVYQMEL